MGGSYYDRAMESTADTSSTSQYSDSAATAMGRTGADPSTSPKNRELLCELATPIVIAMDVTRSRGDDSKILYDKLPMLYGQIMMKNYVQEPALSFAAIGDVPCKDLAPIQVCNFATGNELDEWIKKLWLEEGGGGTGEESYEMAAYCFAFHSTLKCNANGKKGFFFITGDESYYPLVKEEEVSSVVGDDLPETMSAQYVFSRLQQKYNVFFLFPKKSSDQRRQDIDAEIAARLKREGAKTGDVAVSLAWDSKHDLDLSVIAPSGEKIFFSHKKSKCGGELDVDMNVHGESTTPVENIYWPVGGAPVGHYKVQVTNYAFHGPCSTGSNVPFRVQIKVGSETTIHRGQTSGEKNPVTVAEFNFSGGIPANTSYEAYSDETILANWAKVIPRDRILVLEDPKAIVDVMLGVLSVSSGSRTLEEYVGDMTDRGQSETRISQVREVLKGALLKDYTPDDDPSLS